MDNLLSVTFEAHNDERNHHRYYQIRVGRDLFGAWTVVVSYGRTGRGGKEIRCSAANPELIQQVIRDRLRRRLNASRRIGCSYRLREMNAVAGIYACDWLPSDCLTRLS